MFKYFDQYINQVEDSSMLHAYDNNFPQLQGLYIGIFGFAKTKPSMFIPLDKIDMVTTGNVHSKSLRQLLFEVETVRSAIIAIYKSFTFDFN